MKKLILILITSAFTAPMASFAAENTPNTEEQFASPYFIDGIHCEGFRFETNSTWPYTDADAKEARKAQVDAACLGFFKTYGIDLFQWYTPENIENVANAIRKADEFKSVELNLKKSDLPNHIHLFLKITPETNNIKNLSVESRTDKGRGSESTRTTNKISFDWTDNKNYPVATSKYGFKHLKSNASNSVGLENSPLSEMNKDIIGQNTFEANDLYWMGSFPYGKQGFGVDMGIHILPNNINSAHTQMSDVNYNLSFLSKQKSLLGTSEIGLVFDHSTVLDYYYSPFSKRTQTTEVDRLGLALKFNSGNPKGGYVGTSMLVFAPRSSKEKVFAIYDVDFRWTVDTLVDQAYLAVNGMSQDIPEIGLYRRYIGHANSALEFGVNKYLKSSYGNTQLSAFLGVDAKRIDGIDDSNMDFYTSNSYVGVKAKVETEQGWNIEAKLGLSDGRLQ